MAENNSIDNLSRQDLLTVLGGFIKQTEQINEIEDKRKSRYDDIAHEVVRTEYKKEPKSLVIAYFLAPFSSNILGWLFGFLGDYALIMLLFLPINFIKDLSRGTGLSVTTSYTLNHLGLLLLWVLLGIIGYFMGRKDYMKNWVEKAIKKGTYNNEIDAAVDSDPQTIDYKNKLTSLMNDATYQQYCSLVPHIAFTLFDIKMIYQMLLDYRADNFKEAVNAWRQEQHDREVEREKQMAEMAKQRAEREAELAERQAELAERKAERQARNAKTEATASTIVDTLFGNDRFEREYRKIEEKEKDQAIKDIAKELKRLKK